MSRYTADKTFSHDMTETTGVLLCNLGTPDAPTPAAVRRYLVEFLSDPRIVDLPRALWWLMLHGVILRIRPKPVSRAYASIWMDEGSPLLVYSRRQAEALQKRMAERGTPPMPVALGMTYGKPSIADALVELRSAGVQRLLVLPLYPQYSAATTAASFDAVTRELQRWRWLPEIRTINQYHDDPAYIDALVSSVHANWGDDGPPDKLLISFHGMPKATLAAGDPYFCHCQKTGRLLAERLGLPDNGWQLAFQSRFGKAEWLQPYADETLKDWGRQAIGRVDVICPGFSVDCLETLEEMAMRFKAVFLAEGGGQLRYIPALNDRPEHIDMLAGLIERHTAKWAGDSPDSAGRAERARAMGAEK